MSDKMIKPSNAPLPILATRFENLLWANTPSDWIVKSTFVKNNLYIVIIPNNLPKMRRKFSLVKLKSKEDNLWDFAVNCIQEMQKEVAQD